MSFAKIVDLTYGIHKGMLKYPSDPDAEIEINPAKTELITTEVQDGGGFGSGAGVSEQKYVSGNMSLRIKNHHGTHIDAPAHKFPGGKTIDEYGIEKFVNKAVVIDLRDRGILSREKRAITIEDLDRRFDSDYLRTEHIKAVLFYTGFCDEIAENEARFADLEANHANQNAFNAKKEFEKQFPYFTPRAAAYVANAGSFLNIVGIDSFSVDPQGSNSENHRAFLSRNILLLETVVNLAELKKDSVKYWSSKFTLNCVPLIYKGADAAQTRAYACLGEFGY